MKFLLVLVVLVAAAFAKPHLPSTFQTHCKTEWIYSYSNVTKFAATETLAMDRAKNASIRCTLYDGWSTAYCRLSDYQKKTLYSYERDSLGEFTNCTTTSISANASMHMYNWAWVSNSTNAGITEFPYCKIKTQTWELSYGDKFTLKMGVSDKNSNQPVATIVKVVNDYGYYEVHTCYDRFSTTVDPNLFTVPRTCQRKTRLPVKNLPGLDGFL